MKKKLKILKKGWERMKKFLKQFTTLLMAAILFVSTMSCAGAAIVKRPFGDVDNNGAVTVADARLALRSAVNLEELDEDQTIAADIDGDGHVSVADARMILRAAVHLEDLGVYEITIDDGLIFVIKIYKKYPFIVVERKK